MVNVLRAVVVCGLAIATLSACENSTPEFLTVHVAGQPFQMELAMTPKTRMRGLSDRKDIPDGSGMLFVLPKEETVNFVMRKCLFAIDIVYLDSTGQIVSMHEMAVQPYGTPERELKAYPSHKPVQFAMEFKSGAIRKLDLHVGERIDLPFNELRSRAR